MKLSDDSGFRRQIFVWNAELDRCLNNVIVIIILSDVLLTFLDTTFYFIFWFQIYSDPESEKAIMSSVVYCIHNKEGCKWSDELRKLKVNKIKHYQNNKCDNL